MRYLEDLKRCLCDDYIVEYDFNEGINVIPQEDRNFTLANGDKVMLWYDLIDLVPVCDELTIK